MVRSLGKRDVDDALMFFNNGQILHNYTLMYFALNLKNKTPQNNRICGLKQLHGWRRI